MSLEALQRLFKDIIDNGITMQNYYFALSILIISVASALGAYFGSYFKKRGEEKAISDSFYEIKERLSQTTKLTEDIKASINISTIEHQIKFSKYHDKSIEATEKLFELLVNLETKTERYILDSLPNRNQPELFHECQLAVGEILLYSSYKKYWIEEELFDKIYKTALEIENKAKTV